jgi:hypothetical protein
MKHDKKLNDRKRSNAEGEDKNTAEVDEKIAQSFFDRKDVFWAGLVFFASYFFYLISLFPTVASEDSGEFAAAAHTLGVAHPPGYPLFVILAKIFETLLPFGDVAWRINVFSAFFGAAAVAGIYFLVKLLTKDTALGVATALFFAGGEIFWSQAIRAEVYTLNTFFLVLVILLAVLWHFTETAPTHNNEGAPVNHRTFEVGTSSKVFYWLSFIYGLSLANHQLMFLVGPPLFIFILITRPKIFLDYRLIGKAALWFLLGLSVYLFLPLAASYKPEVNWGNPVTWDNFWTHVTRKIYSADSINTAGELVSATQNAAQSATALASAQTAPGIEFLRLHVWEFTRRFIVILDGNYSWIIGLLAIFGGIFLWLRSKPVFWFFIALVIFNSTVMSALTGVGIVDKLPSLYFTDRPFFIPLLMLVVVMGGLGVRYINSLYYAAGKRTAPARKRPAATLVLAVLFIAILAFRFPAQNQSDNYIANDIAKATLDLLPKDAVLHSENGDNTALPILYLQTVERYRRDVSVYINMPFSVFKYFRSLGEMERENPGRRIFTDFPFTFDSDKQYVYMGPVAEIVPAGTLSPASPPVLPDPARIRGLNKNNLDFFHLYIKARFYLDLGLALPAGSSEQKIMYEKAFTVAPLSRNITGQLIGNYYVRNDEFAAAIPYLQAAREFMPDEYPISFQLAISLIISDDFTGADSLINKLNPDTRELLLKELGIYANLRGTEYPALLTYIKGKQ